MRRSSCVWMNGAVSFVSARSTADGKRPYRPAACSQPDLFTSTLEHLGRTDGGEPIAPHRLRKHVDASPSIHQKCSSTQAFAANQYCGRSINNNLHAVGHPLDRCTMQCGRKRSMATIRCSASSWRSWPIQELMMLRQLSFRSNSTPKARIRSVLLLAVRDNSLPRRPYITGNI